MNGGEKRDDRNAEEGAPLADGASETRLPPGLYVIGTPIGHLGDLTFRARETLCAADTVFAEDTRVTRRLLTRYRIPAHVISCHRFNERARENGMIARIRAGEVVALVTDSGMPAVSDPGARIVAACRAAGLPITAIPGPSSVTTALALSGFESAGFRFAGFLPPKSGARRRRLEALAEETDPVVCFESPHRFLRLLDDLEQVWGDRPVFVGRELTKRFEETLLGTPVELKAAFAGRAPRGEFVLVLGPAPGRKRTGSRDATSRLGVDTENG